MLTQTSSSRHRLPVVHIPLRIGFRRHLAADRSPSRGLPHWLSQRHHPQFLSSGAKVWPAMRRLGYGLYIRAPFDHAHARSAVCRMSGGAPPVRTRRFAPASSLRRARTAPPAQPALTVDPLIRAAWPAMAPSTERAGACSTTTRSEHLRFVIGTGGDLSSSACSSVTGADLTSRTRAWHRRGSAWLMAGFRGWRADIAPYLQTAGRWRHDLTSAPPRLGRLALDASLIDLPV